MGRHNRTTLYAYLSDRRLIGEYGSWEEAVEVSGQSEAKIRIVLSGTRFSVDGIRWTKDKAKIGKEGYGRDAEDFYFDQLYKVSHNLAFKYDDSRYIIERKQLEQMISESEELTDAFALYFASGLNVAIKPTVRQIVKNEDFRLQVTLIPRMKETLKVMRSFRRRFNVMSRALPLNDIVKGSNRSVDGKYFKYLVFSKETGVEVVAASNTFADLSLMGGISQSFGSEEDIESAVTAGIKDSKLKDYIFIGPEMDNFKIEMFAKYIEVTLAKEGLYDTRAIKKMKGIK